MIVFVLEKWPLYFLEAPNFGYVAADAFLFLRKMVPIFLEALTCGYVAAGVFVVFFQKNCPQTVEVTWVSLVWVCDRPF